VGLSCHQQFERSVLQPARMTREVTFARTAELKLVDNAPS
jgi:hypothetical protein